MQSIKNHTMHVPSVMDPQNIGSFIECRAHHLVAGSRDSAGNIFFTRLILLRCQPEQRSYRLRLRDPARIVYRRLEGNCHHRTNARHCHQPAADRVFTNNREYSLVQYLVLRFQSCPRRKHRLSNALQRGMTCHQFPNPRFKRFAGHLADLQAETTQDSPNAQFHIQQPSEKLLARDQQRSNLLRSNRFGVHRLEPSHPQQLGKPTRILAVRLHGHRRQWRLRIPRLQQNGFKFPLASARHAAIVITAPPQTQSDSLESQVPSRNKQGLPARSRPSPPSRSCPAPPQRKRSRVPKRRRFRHSVPRLSSISDAWGRLNVVTPFHHLSGDSHLHCSLGAGPITASGSPRPRRRREPLGATELAGAHRWLPGDLGPRLPPLPILLEVRFRFLERGCPPLGSHASARVDDDGDCPAPSEFVARTVGWVFIEAADRAAVLKDSVVFLLWIDAGRQARRAKG